jgi:2'-5' RNA ligase
MNPSTSRRLFVAAPIPDEVRENLRALQDALRPLLPNVRWVKDDGIHVTLQFLGGTDESLIPEIEEALKEVSRNLKKFEAACAGIGVFPRVKGARVIWAGVEGDVAAFEELQRGVAKALRQVGFKPERRRFTPHVTLGRVRGGERPDFLQKALDEHRGEQLGGFRVESFALYESILRPEGAEYRVVKEFFLGAES